LNHIYNEALFKKNAFMIVQLFQSLCFSGSKIVKIKIFPKMNKQIKEAKSYNKKHHVPMITMCYVESWQNYIFL